MTRQDLGQSQRIDLDRILLANRLEVPAGIRELVLEVEHRGLDMVLHLTGYALGQHLPARSRTCSVRFEYRTPASWWDHFKLIYGLRWWLRAVVKRWPVRYDRLAVTKDVTITVQDLLALYPEATIAWKGVGQVSFAQMKLTPDSFTVTDAGCR